MIKRRLLRWSLVLVVLGAFAVWLEPTRVIWGWLRGEAFYQGRPTSWWAARIEPWDSYCSMGRVGSYNWRVECRYFPKRGTVDRWLVHIAKMEPPVWPIVLDGDSAAAGVLHELKHHSREIVRKWATEGINRLQTKETGPIVSVWWDVIRNTRDKDLPGTERRLELLLESP